jgi:protein O-mannosyl-transferase
LTDSLRRSPWHLLVLLAAFTITLAVYWPGLSGGFLFDDYPNIVDNKGVQPHDASLPSLIGAALSSPASDFKRPLASLSFAINYLTTGIDPYWMKLTNLLLHLLNGWLVYLLALALLRSDPSGWHSRAPLIAVLITAGWMLLPINLTAVLYVVQRMESMANLFVLLGLLGYVAGRRRMLGHRTDRTDGSARRGFILCAVSITVPTAIGLMAKETAVMLPMYALLIEWAMFHFGQPMRAAHDAAPSQHPDPRIIGLFLLVLALPMVMGLSWLLPGVLRPETWATRDFTLGTRLLSETRIVTDYVVWTLLPTPSALSFYHDDFHISTGLLSPWNTLASIVFLAALITLMLWLRPRKPLAALGIALFLSCQLLTGTILPLELIYEHRNYLASFGLLLVVMPLLIVPRTSPLPLPRYALLAGLMLCWTTLSVLTAYAWGNPLRLAEDLATRAPLSPRAQYELGRTYIIYSHYNPASPFTQLAYRPLEKAAALPNSSILPEQALIFMNARMELPLKDAWWDSMIAKLKAHKPGVQDESSLGALTQCAHEGRCNLPKQRMIEAFLAALSHPHPSARLLATYGDYAWNVLDDRQLGLLMTHDAIDTAPRESAYRVTQIRMQLALGNISGAMAEYQKLAAMNIGGSLDADLVTLRKSIDSMRAPHTCRPSEASCPD